MNWLSKYLEKSNIVNAFLEDSATFSHLSLFQETLLICGSVQKRKEPLFVVKENEFQAMQLVDSLQRLQPDLRVVYYNQEESLRVETIVQSEVMQSNRIDALYRILSGNFDVCITHAIASVRKISSPQTLKDSIITVHIGDDVDINDLLMKLHFMGYRREKYVEKPFTYAMRGGILDIYSIQMEKPLRIEFFDTEVESLRYFDIDSQRSEKTVDEATIVFATEVILSDDNIQDIIKPIDHALKHASEPLRDSLEIKKDQLLNGMYDASLYPLLSFWNESSTIFDFIGQEIILVSTENGIHRTLDQNEQDVLEFQEEMIMSDTMIPFHEIYHDFNQCIQGKTTRFIQEFQGSKDIYLPWHQANIVSESLSDTLQWLKKEAISNRVIIALDDQNMESFINELLNNSMNYSILSDFPKDHGIYLDYSEIEQGFILDDVDVQVYTAFELYHFKRRKFRYDDKFAKAEHLNQLQDLDTSDYVVHRQYGIGKYMGIATKEIEGIEKDFMRIQYRDNDELFVPLEQFNLVRKYMSSEAMAVRLSKLGSSVWQKSKERVEADIAMVADKLIQLYSSRMDTKGFAYQKDTEYQIEFEKSFPYDLTPDQVQAVKEIKADMESDEPMDRLLIGDVGFGKTEVAIRAAFKAFVDHKQVVFLCPTTILSAQHMRTFKERFENYPIVVEVLNRFVSDTQQKDIIKRVKEGKVDVLIGTHRVLSRDVKFKDLGLLIIDEEQRFGVEHKERIKELKVSVDVLSLSATPIPRTLQMSLIGLRSLSQLNTAPSNRLPVMTYVIEKNEKTIHDIIAKEINRGGQVFYLFNNVEQIYNVANHISRGNVNASVAVVHGQMDRTEIEDVMVRFIAKEYNVLVCTTIIETGIDIPNANTILVDNAQRFGLSQLYQIKGRVGRSDRLAYAYFMIPSSKNLTEVAQKRLQAIKEFTQLGSGYKIAMRDLTIRGAGELLGGNQSGFIDTVGIDLYVELLKEAIDKRKGLKVEDSSQTESSVSVNVSGYLPENFVEDDTEKLEIYQFINNINTVHDLQLFYESMTDRYGSLPQAVQMLLEKKRLEIFLADDRIDSFKERVNRVELVFTQEYSDIIDGVALFETVSQRSVDIVIKYINRKITLHVPIYKEWTEDLIYILDNVKEKQS